MATQTTTAPAITGELREGIEIGTRQRLGGVALAFGIVALLLVAVFGYAGQMPFRLGSTDSGRYLKTPIGLIIVPIVMLAFGPKALLPKGFGIRSLKQAQYRARLKKEYGLKPLYRRTGLMRNLIIEAVLLALVVIMLVLAMGTLRDEGAHTDPGMAIAFVGVGLSALGLGLTVPLGSDRVVRVDDTGNVYL